MRGGDTPPAKFALGGVPGRLLHGHPHDHAGGAWCILARVLARILALTAAIWHNDKTGQPVMRSLTAYDH